MRGSAKTSRRPRCAVMLQNPKLTLPPRKNLLRDAAEVETFSSAAFATCTPASFTIERHYFDRTGTTFIRLPCRLCFLICSGTWPVSRLPAAASCAPAGLGALARSMGLPLQKIHAPNLLELAGAKDGFLFGDANRESHHRSGGDR